MKVLDRVQKKLIQMTTRMFMILVVKRHVEVQKLTLRSLDGSILDILLKINNFMLYSI